MFVYNFYKFISIPELSIKKDILLKSLGHLNIKGTILLASEGINVNISQEKQPPDRPTPFQEKQPLCRPTPFQGKHADEW